MAAFGAFFLYLFIRLAFPEALRQTLGGFLPALVPPASAETAGANTFVRIVDAVSKLSIPFMLSAFPLYAALRHVKVYEEFVDGAKEGFDVAHSHHSLPGGDPGGDGDVPRGGRH